MRPLVSFALALVLLGCADDAPAEPWAWNLPPGFPTPRVPADNPMSAAKVELGRRLFYDRRLSDNGTQACASCHVQAHAFAEARTTSLGSTGQAHFRNAMSLTNVAYNVRQTWANPALVRLEQQAMVPMFGDHPVELGLGGHEGELIARLAADPDYVVRFGDAFPDARQSITLDTIVLASGGFERTLISSDSPYDRYHFGGDASALSADALSGLALFQSERLGCAHCHGDFDFSATTVHESATFEPFAYHNNGLYNLDGEGAYPALDQGLFDVTHDPRDKGRFKAPTLRNIALTAPYMHDGSLATLDAVVDHYAAGGRVIVDGRNAGDGRMNPNKSELVQGFSLTVDERHALLVFLDALSDEAFVTDPRFANPFPSE